MTFAYTGRDAMRPLTLNDFTGQPALTAKLGVLLQSAKGRGQLPDHVLLAGPPGLGKTTLAHILAQELGLPLSVAIGPALEKPADIISLLHGRTAPGVVFIDEIHRMGRAAEEMLYPAMEDGKLPIRIGEGRDAEQIQLDLAPFVLVGATTQIGMVAAPLRDRFGMHARLRPYGEVELADIVQANAGKLGLILGDGAAGVIASRSRGTPRVANQLLSRVRDVAQISGAGEVSAAMAGQALDDFGTDLLGVDEVGRLLLEKLCSFYGGGPVGVNSLATSIGETADTVETVFEPHLLEVGLLRRTPQGRVATAAGFRHVGHPVPQDWAH